MTKSVPTVHVVDDDQQMRDSVRLMLESAGLAVQTYDSAENFLDQSSRLPRGAHCLIVDVRLPGLSGLGLQQKLLAEGFQAPIILITAFGDIPTAVQAIRTGAFDFLEKPFHRRALLERVRKALDQHALAQYAQSQQRDIDAQLETLSAREKDVLQLLLLGKSSKEIAAELSISSKTVLKHRANILDKTRTNSVVELIRQLGPKE